MSRNRQQTIDLKISNRLLKLVIRIITIIAIIPAKIKYLIYTLYKVKIFDYNNSNNFLRIGFVDQDGLIHVPLKYQRLFNSNDLYTEGEFLYRNGTSVNLLLKEGIVLVEKIYHRRKYLFYNELVILNELKDIDCVPKIFSVDFINRKLVINYIDGYVLREKIAKHGAMVRDIDKKINADLGKSPEKYIDTDLIVKDLVSRELFQKIRESVNKVHQKKIQIVDIKYGNIIIKDDKPYIIDFNNSRLYKYLPLFIFNQIKKSDDFVLKDLFLHHHS